MPRPRASERLDDVIEAATAVFIAKGYRRAQMADVTDAMGLSPGALYRYVESKEALFDLVIRAAATPEVARSDVTFPLPTPPPGATLTFVRDLFQREGRLPSLRAALAQPTVTEPQAELTEIAHELYRLVARRRRAIALVERSALDWPELAALWFGELRAQLIDNLARYLSLRIGHQQLRPVPDPTVAARLIVEVNAYFAMHRHSDPYPTPMDDAAAEATAVDAVVHAYRLS